MSNYCNFVLTISGIQDDRDCFANVFQSTVAEIDGGPYDGEKYAELADATWGQTNKDEPQLLYLKPVWHWNNINHKDEDLDSTVCDKGEQAEIRGYCKWDPPLDWLERVSNLMPALTFHLAATTDHERYEEWIVSSGEARRVKLEVVRWKPDGEEWIPLDPNTDPEDYPIS